MPRRFGRTLSHGAKPRLPEGTDRAGSFRPYDDLTLR
jgi:hypothetical protein